MTQKSASFLCQEQPGEKREKKMLQKLNSNKILWLIAASLSLVAALIGMFDPAIYSKVVSREHIPGTFSQDLMTSIASLTLLFLSILTKEEDAKKQMVILGIVGYLFYAYGILVIGQVYTVLYLVYMAIFGLAFWSLVYGVVNIRQEILYKMTLSKPTRYVSVVGLLLQPLIFYPLWISSLIPLMQTGQRIEFLYSIYILDLCFTLPAFILLAVMTLKKEGLGLVLAPAMFIQGSTLMFSVVIGELMKPFYRLTPHAAEMITSLILSLTFLVLAGFHLWNLGQGTKERRMSLAA
jgi:hypothetical protein